MGIPGSAEEVVEISVQLSILKGRLDRFEGWCEGKDLVVWLGNPDSTFSVASCYGMYEKARTEYGPPTKYADVFGLLWELVLPFKIKAFGWRLFHDRLPMKILLVDRGMYFPLDDLYCTFCGIHVEDRDHFFFGCWVVKNIWKGIASWVGKGDSLEEECLANFME